MKQATDFLVDISDKMDKKLNVTQKILTDEIAPSFDFSSGVFGMRIFKSIVGSPIIIKSLDLAEPNTKADFISKSTTLPMASGGCPLTATIKESIDSLNVIDTDSKQILLITAGEDTDNGVYEYEVEKANTDVHINIIGIGMRDSDFATAKKVADMTKGACCNIPADQFTDVAAIRQLIAPVLDSLKGQYVVSSTLQQEKPAQKPVEVSAPNPKPVEEKNIASQPFDTTEKNISKPKVEISTKNFAKEAEAIQAVTVEPSIVQASDYNPVKEMEEATSSIKDLLQSNLNTLLRVLENGKQTEETNQKLREAEKTNLSNIEKLQEALSEANATIEQLKQISSEKDDEITALNANKEDLLTVIKDWQERDRNVIIDLDAKERELTSSASEKYLFEYLEKKYPQRVKWCNQNGKATKGYDFEIVDFENNVTEYYIACKGSKDDSRTFFLTEKEWNLCLNNNLNYQVYLVRNIGSTPKVILIDNLIGCVMSGKVIPGALKNEKVKAGHVMLTLTK